MPFTLFDTRTWVHSLRYDYIQFFRFAALGETLSQPLLIFLSKIHLQASCKRFVSQLLNLALRAAKKYDERETVTWMNQIAKYTVFISSAVDADGNLFKEVSNLFVTLIRKISIFSHRPIYDMT